MRILKLLALVLAILALISQQVYPIEAAGGLVHSNALGTDFEKLYVERINQARESIDLAIFTLTSSSVLRALNAAAGRGVIINIYYDQEHNPALAKKLNHPIQAHAVSQQGLMHHKICVIDGKKIFMGSANFSHDSLKNNGNLVLETESAELGTQLLAGMKRLPHWQQDIALTLDKQEAELFFMPNPPAVKKLTNLIDTAKKCVQVAQFTFTSKEITEALIRAKRRGIEVAVVIDHGNATGCGKDILTRLTAAKIHTLVHPGPELFHYKSARIDDTLVLGSANWTYAAFHQNSDAMIFLKNCSPEQLQFWQLLWARFEKEAKEPQACL